jgi:hypothetical protein
MQNSAANGFNGAALNTVFITGNLQKLGEGLTHWFWKIPWMASSYRLRLRERSASMSSKLAVSVPGSPALRLRNLIRRLLEAAHDVLPRDDSH